mmetsp:Transcript_26316/g.61401  ORF Transcript_26316/g.61401 Transcript_26316/m.61401 type:complete len:294 (+) Transcript_26316:103-984(+)
MIGASGNSHSAEFTATCQRAMWTMCSHMLQAWQRPTAKRPRHFPDTSQILPRHFLGQRAPTELEVLRSSGRSSSGSSNSGSSVLRRATKRLHVCCCCGISCLRVSAWLAPLRQRPPRKISLLGSAVARSRIALTRRLRSLARRRFYCLQRARRRRRRRRLQRAVGRTARSVASCSASSHASCSASCGNRPPIEGLPRASVRPVLRRAHVALHVHPELRMLRLDLKHGLPVGDAPRPGMRVWGHFVCWLALFALLRLELRHVNVRVAHQRTGPPARLCLLQLDGQLLTVDHPHR